jgi:hypothetical protein
MSASDSRFKGRLAGCAYIGTTGARALTGTTMPGPAYEATLDGVTLVSGDNAGELAFLATFAHAPAHAGGVVEVRDLRTAHVVTSFRVEAHGGAAQRAKRKRTE